MQDVNRLLKQFDQMSGMMKKLRKLGPMGMMGMAKNMLGGNAFEKMMSDMGGMPGGQNQQSGSNPLAGPNPFANFQLPPNLLGTNPFNKKR